MGEAYKFLGAELRHCESDDLKLDSLKEEISGKIPRGAKVQAFTDGSTDKSDFSGSGVCLVSCNKIVWSGGFRVISGASNYVAERLRWQLLQRTPPYIFTKTTRELFLHKVNSTCLSVNDFALPLVRGAILLRNYILVGVRQRKWFM